VNVEPGAKRFDKAGIVGEVGNDTQLDLVVVPRQQLTAPAWHEGFAGNDARSGCAHGMLCRFGCRTKPSSAGDGLVEEA